MPFGNALTPLVVLRQALGYQRVWTVKVFFSTHTAHDLSDAFAHLFDWFLERRLRRNFGVKQFPAPVAVVIGVESLSEPDLIVRAGESRWQRALECRLSGRLASPISPLGNWDVRSAARLRERDVGNTHFSCHIPCWFRPDSLIHLASREFFLRPSAHVVVSFCSYRVRGTADAPDHESRKRNGRGVASRRPTRA